MVNQEDFENRLKTVPDTQLDVIRDNMTEIALDDNEQATELAVEIIHLVNAEEFRRSRFSS